MIVEPEEQAELLNHYYSSVFTRSVMEPPIPRQKSNGATLDDVIVTEEQVGIIIDNLREDAAAGPDAIPPLVIKKLKNELMKPLTMLFAESMETGKIPDDWRQSTSKRGQNLTRETTDLLA